MSHCVVVWMDKLLVARVLLRLVRCRSQVLLGSLCLQVRKLYITDAFKLLCMFCFGFITFMKVLLYCIVIYHICPNFIVNLTVKLIIL